MRLRPTIRGKILLGFLLPSLCLGALAAYSYATLRLIETRITGLERIDDIKSSILDFRRQEKNYLLYGETEAFRLVLGEVDAVLRLFDRLPGADLEGETEDLLQSLNADLLRYRSALVDMPGAMRADREKDVAQRLRSIGKELVAGGQKLSERERRAIVHTTDRLRSQLLCTAGGVAVLLAALLYLVMRHIMRPLKMIESVTEQIARGRFLPFAAHRADDEIARVQAAFNRMARELRHRQNQIVQAQKLAGIGTLSAGIAHQVNNPLNNISTSAQILRQNLEKGADALNAKMLGNIDRETARARDIIRGLLDFARHSDLTVERIALRPVVESAVGLASSQLPAGVALEVDVPADLEVLLDRRRMVEALLNLVINAIQAVESPPGRIRLYMDEAPPAGLAVLVVEDTGKGIAAEDLPHIFDPFFTKKEVGKGTGLGLSVAYGIIEECGGDIRVESGPEGGARFYVGLPVPGDEANPCREMLAGRLCPPLSEQFKVKVL